MFRRIFSFILLAWALGFAWFAFVLPQPAGDVPTDAVVAMTGGGGRIERGIEVVRRGWADRLLISGVDREVQPDELQSEFAIPARLFECCVTPGYDAVDTRSNAAEAAGWIAQNDYRSLRLVTSDWHMRRAAFDLEQVLDADVEVIRDAVATQPPLDTLFLEYHKLLARHVAAWFDL